MITSWSARRESVSAAEGGGDREPRTDAACPRHGVLDPDAVGVHARERERG
jgi:hypothetical protein